MTDNNLIKEAGKPLPLGPSYQIDGVNFALFCRHGSSVSLIFRYQDSNKLHQVELDPTINKTGDIWHIHLKTNGKPLYYGYRIDNHRDHDEWQVESDSHIALDPYCRHHKKRVWGEKSEAGKKPVCIADERSNFDWQGDRHLQTPASETIIYELHVRGFTNHPSSKVSDPGTFRALVEKIPYLKELGITAVELLPVTEWDETDNNFFNPITTERLLNYWGYNPLSFFALRSGLAADPDDVANEFKYLVRSFHQAGIEVILDLVFNHTGENDRNGTTSCFRALDNSIYYLIDKKENRYHNFSGCGNTVNCHHPVVRRMILDSLRYFVTEFHIDGFRFDLAAIFSRDSMGNPVEKSPLIELIAEDPILRHCKIIAEAWDAAGLYQVGSFSTNKRWMEWNGKYRDDIRKFMSGQPDSVQNLATRIAGSSDLYQDDGRGPLNSINFITSHDGFTLYDLVSYNRKHNEVNGQRDKDGENHNLSWNSGFEGSPASSRIERLRQRRIKTFTALLLISQGIPMICAGDEMGRSQRGNNNSWCQDNEISWLNWRLTDTNKNLLRFFKKCIEMRKQYGLFRREELFTRFDESTPAGSREISWHSLTPNLQNWSPDSLELGILINGGSGKNSAKTSFFIMVNGNKKEPKTFTLSAIPNHQRGDTWARIVDTAADSPFDFVAPAKADRHNPGSELEVESMGLVILQATT